MSTLLRFDEVRFRRGGRSWYIPGFDLNPGDSVFLEGASGSGKSTLLALASGLLVPQEGQVLLNELPFSAQSEARRDRLRGDYFGFIFQQFNLIDYLSVKDNVLLTARFSPKRRTRAVQGFGSEEAAALHLLDILGISGLVDQPAGQLSVGQQQRVAAARAFLGEPALVLADEPTSALDAASRTSFMSALFDLASAHQTALLFVSHDAALKQGFKQLQAMRDWQEKQAA